MKRYMMRNYKMIAERYKAEGQLEKALQFYNRAYSLEAVKKGYSTLKVKVGKEPSRDIERMKAIREAVGYDIKLRIDANQGWKPKEAIGILRRMEDQGLDIELVEQPVIAHDFEGLKLVTDNVSIPVMADESIFSPAPGFGFKEIQGVSYK